MPTCEEIHELIARHCPEHPTSQTCIAAIELCHTKGCVNCPAIPPQQQAHTEQRTEPLTLDQATDNLIRALISEVNRLRPEQ